MNLPRSKLIWIAQVICSVKAWVSSLAHTQKNTRPHEHRNLFMPSMLVSIFVEEGNHGSFTFAHHPYCVPADLNSLEDHLRGEQCDMGSFLYLDLRTTEKSNVGCTEQLFRLLPCLQQPWKFMPCIAKGHVSLSTTSWLILHWHLEGTSVILSQESVQMKTRTWSAKASFSELHCSNCNTALHL